MQDYYRAVFQFSCVFAYVCGSKYKLYVCAQFYISCMYFCGLP